MKTIGEKNAVSIVACDDYITIRFASVFFFFASKTCIMHSFVRLATKMRGGKSERNRHFCWRQHCFIKAAFPSLLE